MELQIAKKAKTYKEIAKEANLSIGTVESVMNNRHKNPSLETIVAIADVLGYKLILLEKDRWVKKK